MCSTTWHHNITQTQIDESPEEPHSIQYKQGSHDPTITAYKSSTCGSLTCRSTDIYKWKKAKKPDYLPDPAEGTRL